MRGSEFPGSLHLLWAGLGPAECFAVGLCTDLATAERSTLGFCTDLTISELMSGHITLPDAVRL